MLVAPTADGTRLLVPLFKSVSPKLKEAFACVVLTLRFCRLQIDDVSSEDARFVRGISYPIPKRGSFGPEEVRRMAEAYEIALRELRLIDRHAPVTKLIALKILELAHKGELEPAAICAKALKDLKSSIIRFANRDV